MKFRFKIQKYQTEAVEAVVNVFTGQPASDGSTLYRRDIGKVETKINESLEIDFQNDAGWRNGDIALSAEELLSNIRKVQDGSGLKRSDSIAEGYGACNLDVEMETGTGKTYVYIKTMFELHKRYGWSKFIIVVPSIAIREGVAKNFKVLEDHFMEQYRCKARWFVYDSHNLQKIDSYSSDSGVNVMIINTQAFNTSLKEGANNKESRIIYEKRDEFGSRKPIDVISANHPILILDEPQKAEGAATKTALKRFSPLFTLYYSATHKTAHNTVYSLDAFDAFQQKLVKKIQVKGFDVKNLHGTSGYVYLENIILSTNKPPMAKMQIEVKMASGIISRQFYTFKAGESLSAQSRGLGEYDGYVISEIEPVGGYVTFLNGLQLHIGEVSGDVSEDTMRKIQIRETIISHFDKEEKLFAKGIKTLSLFFIDEVAKYKGYDADGGLVHGPYWRYFEETYTEILNERMSLFPGDYQDYLRRDDVSQVHSGYFSIDKRGRAIDSSLRRGTDLSDDTSAYDLILKDKERLLSFDEPVRFIFSHSALREGWDNPNVFQICTLRHADSSTAKRQEVGRGLRLCVDRDGNRMDAEVLGEDVHSVNRLTVIANESYGTFVDALQKETKEVLRERPKKADVQFFLGKKLCVDGYEKHSITEQEAASIVSYLYDNDYIDDSGQVTEDYKSAVSSGVFEPLPKKVASYAPAIHRLVQSIFDEKALKGMVEDGNSTTVTNELNSNWGKDEFQALWNELNHKYVYTVDYDSAELVGKVVDELNMHLSVTELKYVLVTGEQQAADEFGVERSRTRTLNAVSNSTVKYDLVGEIAKGATLTRSTVVTILRGLSRSKLMLFKNNPEEFIREVIKVIKVKKAGMIVEHIGYNQTDGTYDSSIFTEGSSKRPISQAFRAERSIQDYIFTDGYAEESVEKKFAGELDVADEVSVYAKLPRSFKIPTPVGNYSPDWAIAFKKGSVKHIFFVAETKGDLTSLELNVRGIEEAKINCARRLFNELSTHRVRYSACENYQMLLDEIRKIE